MPVGWADIKSANSQGGAAIAGYDPVAYHTQGVAIQGNSKFQYQWLNSQWRFTNETHLQLFKQDPERYMPEYGGYCARAVSLGYIRSINPQVWSIIDDKLLLFHSESHKEKFMQRINQGVLDNANRHWAL